MSLSGRRPLILTLGSRGDVQPFLSLMSTMQQAGAQPLLVTSLHFERLAAEYGMRFASIGDGWPNILDLLGEASIDKDAFLELLVLKPYAYLLPAMLSRISILATEHRADVVIVGMLIWTVEWLRETLALPLVHVHLQPPRWLITERLQGREERMMRYQQLMAQHPQIDADFVIARSDASELHLLAYPQSIGATFLPDAVGVHTGFWHTHDNAGSTPHVDATLHDFLSSSSPSLVCLNFGSMPVYNSVDWMAALLGALEAHCLAGGRLLAIGSLVPPRVLPLYLFLPPSLPSLTASPDHNPPYLTPTLPNAPQVRQFPHTHWVASAPHSHVLPFCRCVVHHGGAGPC